MIVDAYNLFIRSFSANPTISSDGQHVGGIVGFLGSIQKFSKEYFPSQVIVAWEGGGSSRRRMLYPEYKAHRRLQKMNRFYDDIPDTLENRNWQISSLVKIMKHLPILQMYVEDCEADDVIGYLCRRKLSDDEKIIISSDKDFYQFLDERTVIYSSTWKRLVHHEEVLERFGVSSQNFALAKCLCGDDSDNIPGVPGVGFATLAKRFPNMSSDAIVLLEDMLEESKRRKDEKLKIFSRICENEERIRLNWKLIYLDVENLSISQMKKIDDFMESFSPKFDSSKAIHVLSECNIITFDTANFCNVIEHVLRSENE